MLQPDADPRHEPAANNVELLRNDPVGRIANRMIWMLRLLVVTAGTVSAYLLWVGLSQSGLPAGCGAGSGCGSVLSSRWAGVLGVPVSALALATYALVLVATFLLPPNRSVRHQQAAWVVLICMALLITVSAIWFATLQLIVIRAVCPWCMAAHIMGILVSVMIFRMAIHHHRAALDALQRFSTVTVLACLAVATVMVFGLVVGQVLVRYQPSRIHRLPAGKNADSGPGQQREIQIANGAVQLSPHALPVLGSPDAPHLIVVLLDYCCPHCQATHGYLLEALKRYHNQIAIVTLPMPMDSQCNPAVRETESRFEHACELARLALTVWVADRQSFAAFDSWLFESDTPRSPDQAYRKAVELVGAAALEKSMADQWISQQIARNIELYRLSGGQRIPVIMGAEIDTVVGEPENADELFRLLEDGMAIQR